MSYKGKLENVALVKIGEFEVTSGELIVSDPCYEVGTWCAGTLANVLNGKWLGFVQQGNFNNWGNRIHSLIIIHNEIANDKQFQSVEKVSIDIMNGDLEVINSGIDVGVDSGQAGFFDPAFYKNDESVPKDFVKPDWLNTLDEVGEKWYGLCCERTCGSEFSAGVIQGGIVSSSGIGDGSYDCFYQVNSEGKVVVAIISFLLNDDEEDEE